MSLHSKLDESTRFLKKLYSSDIDFSLVLGSGFVPDFGVFKAEARVSYDRIPHCIKPGVKTHEGRVYFGTLAGKCVAVFHGRVHAYEGYAAQEVAYNARIAASLSKQGVILTNLVGGINKTYKIGDFVFINDHINLSDVNPLIAASGDFGNPFVDMYQAYKKEWIDAALISAKRLRIRAHTGVMAYRPGPNFETRAELVFLEHIGADTVGWSIVPEALAVRQLQKNILAVSCVSDIACPAVFGKVDLERIWKVGAQNSKALFQLLKGFFVSRKD